MAISEGAWIENKRTASGEHYTHGEGKIHLTGVKVTKPAGSNCIVYGDEGGMEGAAETIRTEQLTLTSEGQGDALLFKPAVAGQPVATFYLTNCTPPFSGLNGTHTILGSIKSTSIDGATINFTHPNTTTQGTLFTDNEFTPVGIEGTLTLSGRSRGGFGEYTPLSSTTVTTP